MTETEKIYNKIVAAYKPAAPKTKKIVAEAKEIKKEAATSKRTKKQTAEQQVELDEMEKSFISKYIEYSELSLLNQSAEQLTATFEKSLGPNAQAAVKELMEKIAKRENTIKTLAKELTDIKEQMIKETEKARAKETLITLASGITVPTVKSKPQIKQPVNSPDTTDAASMPQTINVVESKKKKK